MMNEDKTPGHHDLELQSNDATFRHELDGTTVVMKSGTASGGKKKRYWIILLSMLVLLVVVIATSVTLRNSKSSSNSSVVDEDGNSDGPDDEIPLPPTDNNAVPQDDFSLSKELTRKGYRAAYITKDGNQLAISIIQDNLDSSQASPNTAAILYDVVTEQNIQVLEFDPSSGGTATQMSFSKDGSRLVFTSSNKLYVYQRDDSSQLRVAEIIDNPYNPKPSVNDNLQPQFGLHHAMSNNGQVLAVFSKNQDEGHVRIFYNSEATDATQYIVKDDILLDDVSVNTISPVSLSDDGSTVVIGVPESTNPKSNATFAGSVRVYDTNFDPIDAPFLVMDDFIHGIRSNELLGGSVVISGDGKTIATAPENGGFVDVFEWDDQTWTPKGNRIDGNPAKPDEGFGIGLAMDETGKYLVVGSPGVEAVRPDVLGEVSLFEFNETTRKWKYLGSVFSRNMGDGFGLTVDLSVEAQKIVVTAPFRTENDEGEATGVVRIYDVPELALGVR